MAIFGKKNDDKDTLADINDLDAKILAAIEETDLEQAELKEKKQQAEFERREELARKREEEEAKAKRIEELRAKLPNGGRRFFVFVEDSRKSDGLIEAEGVVFGEIHKDDSVYAYGPDGKVLPATVKVLEPIKDDSAPKDSKKSRLTVKLKVDKIPEEGKPLSKFTIISGVAPSDPSNKKAPVENPALTGLSLRYKEFSSDKDYMRALMYNIMKARFVLPVHASDEVREDGKKAMKVITMKNPKEEGKQMLPVFTDIAALSAWKTVFDEQHKPSVIVMSFPEAVGFTSKDKLDITLNPMGPVAIHLPRNLIDGLAGTNAFKSISEGRTDITSPAYSKKTIKDASKVVVGEPPRTEETKAVRKALKEYAEGNSSIMALGLLAAIREGRRGYLVIVDCPKILEREIFTDLYTAVKPHLDQIKNVDFSLYAETAFADQYFSKIPFDYVKNPNV